MAAEGIDAASGLRTVSVIAPCRNERRHIGAFVASALAQQVPPGWRLELVVADGQSDDGTRDELARLAAADARLRWIDNPGRIVSAGLNRMLAAASGDVIVRMDIHSEYAPDYVAQCIAALERSRADNVGGPWRAEPDAGAGPLQHAVAAAFQSPAVAGGARSRRLDYEGPVDTVYLGAWPRKTFERFGGFDEQLVRNQDDEHNLRVVKGGGRVWQSRAIRSVYRPRARLGQVARQYLQYGYWKPFVMRKHGQPAALRHLVPALFVAALGAGVLALLLGAAWPLLALLLAYAAAVLAMTAGVARSQRVHAPVLLRVPAVIVVYHLAYGAGSLVGWWDVTRRRSPRAGFGSLTR
ncbi:glycosyltransferase family 2 protein [Piscinibacter koreensis]|uniref:Glycosyltransferase family 2 protein n=1 Tax=Piscinibacter koreensis TaxID=2742824 RepID=A0A7Y6NPI6_9BURK|nr:glycosyltransferase family 2 protein [Schlegelella koreensis]NUZ06988.1 glycosyltransferase family 2 protein [Schlegelella koreensis]